MYRKSAALLLITLLVVSSAAGIGFAGAQQMSSSQLVSGTLLNVLENSHSEVTNLFESVTSEGGDVSEDALEAYDEAIQLRTQAQEEYDLGEFEEAVKTATDALNMYGKAAGKIFEEEEEIELEDDDTEEYLGLFVDHEKSMERLEKLTTIAEDLTAQGIDVSEATDLIQEAQDKLDAMSSALDSGEFESAEALLDEADELIGQTTDSLQSQSKQKKKEKTERFIVKTKSMVEGLEEKMESVLEKYNLSDEDAAVIHEQFQEMKDKLNDIDLDSDEDLDDIIHELKDVVKDSRDIGDDEDEFDDDVIQSLKEINKHESKLERYKERVDELDLLGVNTTELEALVMDAEEALAIALNGTDVVDEDITEDLIEDADDLLDDLDDLIDDVEDEIKDDDDEDESDDDEAEDIDENDTDDSEEESGDDPDEDDAPDDGEDENGDDSDGVDESMDESDDDTESSFDEVLEHVNYYIQTIQEKIDGLAEMGWETLDLELQLSEIKESLKDVRDTDELVEVELEAWNLLDETMSRQGYELDQEGPFIADDDLHVDDGGLPDDDHPDDDEDHDDDDDHGDDEGHEDDDEEAHD